MIITDHHTQRTRNTDLNLVPIASTWESRAGAVKIFHRRGVSLVT